MNFNDLKSSHKQQWSVSLSDVWGIQREKVLELLIKINPKVEVYHDGKYSKWASPESLEQTKKQIEKELGISLLI